MNSKKRNHPLFGQKMIQEAAVGHLGFPSLKKRTLNAGHGELTNNCNFPPCMICGHSAICFSNPSSNKHFLRSYYAPIFSTNSLYCFPLIKFIFINFLKHTFPGMKLYYSDSSRLLSFST